MRRTRVPTKSGALSLFRPTPTQHDDFVDVMQEVLPKLLEATQGIKRVPDESPDEPSAKVPKTGDENAVRMVQHELTSEDAYPIWQDLQNGVFHQVLISQYFQKRAQKEVPQ